MQLHKRNINNCQNYRKDDYQVKADMASGGMSLVFFNQNQD